MSLLLPAVTMILIALGAACLFIAIEHDRALRKRLAGRSAVMSRLRAPAGRADIRSE